ncbi:hypothetical protein Aperf_G00000051995 [Anoplocephala perfoliata]
MKILRLYWIGDLEKDLRFPPDVTRKVSDVYRPKIMEFPKNLHFITIGRVDAMKSNTFNLENCLYRPLISPHHATITRTVKGGFELRDHSLNGTYVNYQRVDGSVTLQDGDIICFGYLDSYGVSPGDVVPPFYSDQKYLVYIGPPEDNIRALEKQDDSLTAEVFAVRFKQFLQEIQTSLFKI